MRIWYNAKSNLIALEGLYCLFWENVYYDIFGKESKIEEESIYMPYPEDYGWDLIGEI